MSNEKQVPETPVENSSSNENEHAPPSADSAMDESETHATVSRHSESSTTTTGSKRPASQQHDHGYRQRIASWIQHESDTDLYIRSLSESLMIHKEIVERIENEKEQYMQAVELERKQERQKAEQERQQAQTALDSQRQEYERLLQAHQGALADLEKKRNEYSRMETNYYSHMRTIRATDDDLSTVQSEISAVLSQVANLCMSLRSKADKEAGSRFVLERWPDKEALVRQHMLSKPPPQQQQQPSRNDDDNDGEDVKMKDGDQVEDQQRKDEDGQEPVVMDAGFIGVFIEKFLVDTLLSRVLQQSIHPGLSINDAFQQVVDWMDKRNTEWATRLRQQVVSLVVRQPMDDEGAVDEAKRELVKDLMTALAQVYPHVDSNTEKKLTNIVNRATKLNLAIKGQDVLVQVRPVDDEAVFDASTMKAASKGKAEGTVALTISPGFAATDPTDDEHGFLVPAKVLCL